MWAKSFLLKLFEISDVVLLDKESAVGATNHRRLIALYTGPTSGFEIIHGLVDRIMLLLETGWAGDGAEAAAASTRYAIEPTESATFFPGRSADLVLQGDSLPGGRLTLGSFGVLHPEVLANYDIKYPCSVIEMDIEPFL